MQVKCKTCGSNFEFDESLVGPSGRKLRCAFCHGVFYITPEDLGYDESDAEEMPPDDPNLQGTMVLSLHNKPKAPDPPPQRLHPGHTRHATFHLGEEDDEEPRPNKGNTVARHPVQVQAPPPLAIPKGGKIAKVHVPTEKKINLLMHNHWTAGFGTDDYAAMSSYTTLFKVPPDTAIFRQGDTNSFMCLIVRGQVKILDEQADSISNQILTILGPNQAFGEMAMIDGQPRTAAALASKESYVLVLTRAKLDRMAVTHPKTCVAIVRKIANAMSRRLRDLARLESEFIRR